MVVEDFVELKELATTSAEEDYIEGVIRRVLNNSFSNPDRYSISKRNLLIARGMIHDITNTIIFEVKGFRKEELRDENGNTYIPTSIKVIFGKMSGYSKSKPEEKLVYYYCTTRMTGHFRGYKNHSIAVDVDVTDGGFSSGSELEDLKCEKDLRDISNYFYHSKPNKGLEMGILP